MQTICWEMVPTLHIETRAESLSSVYEILNATTIEVHRDTANSLFN